MGPASPRTNLPDVGQSDAVVGSDLLRWPRICSDRDHLILGETRAGVQNTLVVLCSTISGASLHNHVTAVIGIGAEKQMIGVETGWVVASVQHAQPVRDWADPKHPSHTMDELGAKFGKDTAVSSAGTCARPVPTTLLVNVTTNDQKILVSDLHRHANANKEES